MWLSGRVLLHRQIPLEKSPTALAERAITLTNKFGYTDPPTDRDYGFDLNQGYLRYILQNDKSPSRWQRLRSSPAPAISFWYNQSPRYFEPFLDSVSIDNPPIPSSMVSVLLDTRGQLRKFVAAPPQVDQGQVSSAEMNWTPVLTEAGFEQATLKPVTSTWVPPVNSDARAAWEGQHAGQPPVPVRIEAAAYHGKPVYFEIIEPWTTPYRAQQDTHLVRLRILLIAVGVLALIVLTGAFLLARHNLRLGRGDRKGAFKLALFIFILQMVAWLFGAHHVFSFGGEFKSFLYKPRPITHRGNDNVAYLHCPRAFPAPSLATPNHFLEPASERRSAGPANRERHTHRRAMRNPRAAEHVHLACSFESPWPCAGDAGASASGNTTGRASPGNLSFPRT